MTPKTDVQEARREPLSAERIVTVAMDIADREGLEALSMRRVASELEATPMALYNHVGGKDELLDGIAGRLLEEMDLSVIDTTDFARAVRTGYGEFRRVLLRHPNLVPVLQRKGDVSPDAMRPVEVALSLLRGIGFSSEEAVLAHWALTGFTMGHVMWQLASPLLDDPSKASHMLDHRRSLPAAEFPCIMAALPFLEACDMDTAFEFGIDALIAGFMAKVAAKA
jgi:TetR/AcrR family transcriptional regulator, tetracycline repressor protein